ncbi:MAG: hypothetical protein JW744_05540, partial [Candidatus Diapherotrites archaeon]|nr:hypothetical protein [Candidatus Diapherotrites archaeon]
VNQQGTYKATVKAADFEESITFQGKIQGTGSEPEPEPADQTILIAGLGIAIIIAAAIALKKIQG